MILMNKVNVLNIKFSNISDDELLNILENAFMSESNLRIVTPNPEIVMAANKSDSLRNMINNSSLVLKDGIGIKIAEKLKGVNGEKRQTGIETTTIVIQFILSAPRMRFFKRQLSILRINFRILLLKANIMGILKMGLLKRGRS